MFKFFRFAILEAKLVINSLHPAVAEKLNYQAGEKLELL